MGNFKPRAKAEYISRCRNKGLGADIRLRFSQLLLHFPFHFIFLARKPPSLSIPTCSFLVKSRNHIPHTQKKPEMCTHIRAIWTFGSLYRSHCILVTYRRKSYRRFKRTYMEPKKTQTVRFSRFIIFPANIENI